MAEEKKTGKSNGLKIALGVALALFLATAFYTINLYTTSQEIEQGLEEEKQLLIEDFKTLSGNYEEVLGQNEIADANLVEANDRIQGLIDSLKTAETNVKILWRYKNRFNSLQKEMKALLAQNDSLKAANSYLQTDLDSTRVSLEERTMFSDSLQSQNTALADVVENASVLSIVGLKGFGIIERSSGKLIPTGKAKRADKIRVCFAVAKNNLVQSGDQELYIQVTDPQSNVLGVNEKVFLKDEAVACSVISKFNYEKRSLDICEFVSSDKEFGKGTYSVKVYNNLELVSTSEFTLE